MIVFLDLRRGCLIFLILFGISIVTSQQNGGENIFKLRPGVESDKLNFKLANNLIVIPVSVNGEELSFILDTGVSSTIIFSLGDDKKLQLSNATKIYLRGLGDGEPVEAIKSTGNTLEIGDAISANHTVYLIFDETIDFSPRMGFPIHGIIGYDFFKNFIVDLKYSKEVIKISNPKAYVAKKCRKCYQTSLDFNNGVRPYIKAQYGVDKRIDLNLLIDSGSGSALWLFENKTLGIKVPEDSYREFLGKGFNGDIHGARSKIKALHIGKFTMKRVTASFPDSVYIQGISTLQRQGSLGGGVLKRFDLIVDYPDQKISFRKNRFFKQPFHYNMSGITVEHAGERLTKVYTREDKIKPERIRSGQKANNAIVIDYTFGYRYSMEPNFEIVNVRPGSPAAHAGLKRGDRILSINGKNAYEYQLEEINNLFFNKEGKRIRIVIDRAGVRLNYSFFLKKVIE
ncbi:aspartyl protease family protein [Aquimarina intermedia]|uniref:PDZ domain-containing protein n=1 Tax=Aquimarina intermedia TaxID=350814 RepID=A0A5S5C5C5_9FLAO|nr:aspartyl protease family protein [Aquimarina intermedia]TYP73606.1 PDZ domain-containing protein [Aquimarina intermedia]